MIRNENEYREAVARLTEEKARIRRNGPNSGRWG